MTEKISHEPRGYECPMCRFRDGVFSVYNRPSDLVASHDRAIALVSPKWWPENDGGVLVVTRTHVENIYDLGPADSHGVWDLVREVATAMRSAYGSEGVSIRQRNEPAGNQDMWHFHVHVLPRYSGDRLYERNGEARWVDERERAPYAEKLREALKEPAG